MSDYTPTTEEVYRRFWRGTPLRSEDKLREYVALDRWLAEVKAQEREQIIDELERERIWLLSTEDEENERSAEAYLDAIATIKDKSAAVFISMPRGEER